MNRSDDEPPRSPADPERKALRAWRRHGQPGGARTEIAPRRAATESGCDGERPSPLDRIAADKAGPDQATAYQASADQVTETETTEMEVTAGTARHEATPARAASSGHTVGPARDATVMDTRAALVFGLRGLLSMPALVLTAANLGYTALAREAGLSAAEAMAVSALVWAIPAQVVFIGMVTSGATLIPVIVAICLSSMRFLPMMMALTPILRGPKTSRLSLIGASYVMAVTSWVFAMAHVRDLPRNARLPAFVGFAVPLTVGNVLLVGVAHNLLGAMPAVVAAALVFLTPVYFSQALYGAAREVTDKLALGAGIVLSPLFALALPGLDLLMTGLVGGTLAYGAGRLIRARRARANREHPGVAATDPEQADGAQPGGSARSNRRRDGRARGGDA